MKPRCWIGCLAMVIRAELAENVGRTCEVIGQVGGPSGPWQVRFPRPVRWVSGCSGRVVDFAAVGLADDCSLMPLGGSRDPGGVAVETEQSAVPAEA